jgi:uncharacterized protein YdeI (YjbR/CyaY-like superfamily)
MEGTNPKVDAFLAKATRQDELERLRALFLDCGLSEELKWGSPCYAFRGHNVVIMGELKDCSVIGFFKGALLSDNDGILLKPGKNTEAARSVKFTTVEQITKLAPVIRAYVHEAIELEKAGLKVDFAAREEPEVPEELQKKLDELPAFRKAWKALTPGRRRGYLLHFADAKQAKTRAARVEKYIERILDGKGMHD